MVLMCHGSVIIRHHKRVFSCVVPGRPNPGNTSIPDPFRRNLYSFEPKVSLIFLVTLVSLPGSFTFGKKGGDEQLTICKRLDANHEVSESVAFEIS